MGEVTAGSGNLRGRSDVLPWYGRSGTHPRRLWTMTDDDTPRKLDLSPIQVMASALAAVSAAFFASWLGTAGTLIGAAVGSVVATVGAATYTYSLNRSAEAVRRRATAVREAAVLGATRPGRSTATPTEQLEAIEEDEARDQPGFWQRLDPRQVSLPWGKVALASAAVMLVALLAITSFEGVTGRSLASLLGNDDSGRTTVGNVVDGGGSTDTEEETPSDEPTQDDTSTDEDDGSDPEVDPTPTADPTPSTDPAPTTEPSPTADPTPSSGTSPTADPTTAP